MRERTHSNLFYFLLLTAQFSSTIVIGYGVGLKRDAWGLWPRGIIPYDLPNDLASRALVASAVEIWNSKMSVKWVPRTDQVDYVGFETNGTERNGGVSLVGRAGGRQYLKLGSGVSLGTVLHEMGHAAGLLHEHNRQDREAHIILDLDAATIKDRDNFRVVGDESAHYGPGYDLESIMQYSSYTFSESRERPVIVKSNAIPIDNIIEIPTNLSAGDVASIEEMYEKAKKRRIRDPRNVWIGSSNDDDYYRVVYIDDVDGKPVILIRFCARTTPVEKIDARCDKDKNLGQSYFTKDSFLQNLRAAKISEADATGFWSAMDEGNRNTGIVTLGDFSKYILNGFHLYASKR